ncbi:hypothetical protein R1flu_008003 [Riccia fluitans]|uniref:Ubiquitin-like protease family profile domain-containing protein n=1 Tax=Riccia fluitans TaxID=41844 RepID=A0ABD1YAG8_9MARC
MDGHLVEPLDLDVDATSHKKNNNHWSLAIIWIHNNVVMLAHLDSFRGTHDPEAIFHVLRTVLCLTMPIDPALVQTGIMNVEQQ